MNRSLLSFPIFTFKLNKISFSTKSLFISIKCFNFSLNILLFLRSNSINTILLRFSVLFKLDSKITNPSSELFKGKTTPINSSSLSDIFLSSISSVKLALSEVPSLISLPCKVLRKLRFLFL